MDKSNLFIYSFPCFVYFFPLFSCVSLLGLFMHDEASLQPKRMELELDIVEKNAIRVSIVGEFQMQTTFVPVRSTSFLFSSIYLNCHYRKLAYSKGTCALHGP